MFENTLVTIPFKNFSSKNASELFKKNCTIVYLNFSKKVVKEYISKIKDKNKLSDEKVSFLTFDEQNQFCLNNCDIKIDVPKIKLDSAYKIVKKSLDKYLL